MAQLCALPFLVGDPAMDAFISKTSQIEFDAAKKVVESSVDLKVSAGCMEWRQLLDNLDGPADDMAVERIAVEIRGQLTVMGANLNEIDKNWVSASGFGSKFAAEMDKLTLSTEQWKDFELSVAEPGSDNVLNSMGPQMLIAMNGLATISNQWNVESGGLSENIAKDLLECVQYQQMLAEGLSDLLVQKDETLKYITTLERELTQLRIDKDRFSSGRELSFMDKMQGKNASKVEGSIYKREAKLEKAKIDLVRMGKALWFSEADRFGRERTLKLDQTMKAIAVSNRERSKQNMVVWDDLCRELRL
jgi:hypothetical protein